MQQFDPSARRQILDRIFQMLAEDEQLDSRSEIPPEGENAGPFEQEITRRNRELASLIQAYREGLPIIALSRCPFSGAVVTMAIDTLGLDGLWWNSDSPIRPASQLPDTFFALSGAVRVAEPAETAPFICAPGPQIPFVVPRLLAYDQIKAVITSIQVGRHTAYPIVYFAEPQLWGIERLNDWGSERYEYLDETGVYRANQATPETDGYDYDLADWIKRGKLLWIRPGDATLMLHSDLESCPFLDLAGERGEQFIENGQVSRFSDSLAFAEDDLTDADDPDLLALLGRINAGED